MAPRNKRLSPLEREELSAMLEEEGCSRQSEVAQALCDCGVYRSDEYRSAHAGFNKVINGNWGLGQKLVDGLAKVLDNYPRAQDILGVSDTGAKPFITDSVERELRSYLHRLLVKVERKVERQPLEKISAECARLETYLGKK